MEEEEEGLIGQEKMRALLKERRTEDAWEALQSLTKAGKLPDSQCLSRLVAQLSHQGTPSSLSRAEQVMSYLKKNDKVNYLDCDSLGLLAMASARAGEARYALNILRIMFDMNSYPPVKVWSAVVSRLGRHTNDCPLALELFDDVCSLVREAGSQGQEMNVSVVRPDTAAFNAALNACATLGLTEKAEELLAQLPEFGLAPDTLTFNVLIKVYARTEQRELLKNVLVQMEEVAVEPDQSTLNSLVAAYVGMGDVHEAEMLVKRWQGTTKEKGGVGKPWGFCMRPNVRTYTTLMKGYIKEGRRSDAMQLLLVMQQEVDPRSSPNEVTYTTAISSCVRMGLMDEACSILQEMTAQNVPANVVTYNVLLQGYCRSHQLQKAYGVIADMKRAGISLDVVSYNTLINGCIEVDDNVGALALFKEMRGKGIAPSQVSYTTLMKAFVRNGQPKLVHQVFEEMQLDSRMETDAVAWNVLLDSYGRSGHMADAKRMFQKMKEARCAFCHLEMHVEKQCT